MKYLVLIVEDDDHVKKLLSVILERNGINSIFVSNLAYAIEMFERNKELISYIALDGNLEHDRLSDEPETLVLARIIADSQSFKGTVFAMSSIPDHCMILKEVIGDKCEILETECPASIKFHTVREITRRIIEKRKEEQKS